MQRLSPAPRPLPLVLSIRAVLGGFMSQFGWFFFGFGMIFVWAFDVGDGISESIAFRGSTEFAEGTTTSWSQTSLTVNESPVYSIDYTFRDAAGTTFEGTSYQSGRYIEEGSSVIVEFKGSNPSISRIEGLRASSAGLMVSFVLIFPSIGALFAVYGMRNGRHTRRLMIEGELALGKLVAKEATGTRVNEQTVYRLTFEFEPESGGAYQVEAKSHMPHKLEDEALERLVYNPRDPYEAAMLDALPCRPEINARGDFEVEGPQAGLALMNLIVPGISVVGHGLYLLLT